MGTLSWLAMGAVFAVVYTEVAVLRRSESKLKAEDFRRHGPPPAQPQTSGSGLQSNPWGPHGPDVAGGPVFPLPSYGGVPEPSAPASKRRNIGLWLITIAAVIGLAAFMYATRLQQHGVNVPLPQNPPAVAVTPAPSPEKPSAPQPDNVQTFSIGVFYFAVMLFGMAGQYMWGLKSKDDFNLYEFVKPLWVSFIVFGPFWSSLTVHGISYGAAAAAYQNGFFWKVVFEQQTPKPAKPAKTRT